MAVIYEIKERRVIPNWRDFKRTLQIGELSQTNKFGNPIELNINRSIEDWKQDKNIGIAADLINSAFVSGINNFEVKEAIGFIKSEQEKASSSLLELIKLIEIDSSNPSILSKNSLLEIDVDTVTDFQAFINNKSFHKVINKTKNRSKNELRNPVIWTDLARLYTMRGHEHQAEKAILTALQLAPNNRFVLRSATRFFIHNEKFDKALYYLRKADCLKEDPWLISAHIATSSIMGRFSPFIKDGKRILESGNFSDYEITELSSSLGTLEFKDGSFKKAKELFEKSMRMPNDNSLAQLEWVSKDEQRLQINPFQFDKVINPFEARALELYERGDWNGAFYNSIKWFLDMPFSKRPALMGSYIAGSLLKDKKAAIIFCQVGLQANPCDPTLLNNMVYNLATSNNDQLLDNYVNQMMDVDVKDLPNESKITFQATLGLVALRKGDIETGMNLYKLAIQNATNIKNDYLKNLALANFAMELINLNSIEQDLYIDLVRNMKISEKHKDLELFRSEILEKIKNKSRFI
jgi:tetratricopeptide (TPR) repeat protein